MLVPYFEINRRGCVTCCYNPYVFDTERARVQRMPDDAEFTKYVYNTDTDYVRIFVWDTTEADWTEVGGAPLVKLGASLVRDIQFAHATARIHDYWL